MRLHEKGYPQPTGEFEAIEGDSLVLALGQDVDLSFLERVDNLEVIDGVVKVDPRMMTGHTGVFAGGDMVPAERTVTVAVGHGKKAARNIDAFLRGDAYNWPAKHELAAFEKLNTWYYSDAPLTVQPLLDAARRETTFDEVVKGLDETNALYGVCPDNAVLKLGPGKRFQFNYDYCKGCGMCAAECPCGAVQMVAETV